MRDLIHFGTIPAPTEPGERIRPVELRLPSRKVGLGLALIAIAVMMLAFSRPAAAQSPPLIPVQGTLYDMAGDPINTPLTVVFTLYSDDTGGTVLWTESQVVTFTTGLFTAYLGDNVAIDMSLFADNPTVHLGIAVNGDPEMALIEIATAPYAAYADNAGDADTLEGNTTLDVANTTINMLGPVGDTNTYNHNRYTDTDAVNANTGMWADLNHTHAWGDITSVPGDIADGDADTWGEIGGIPGDIADGDADTWGEIGGIPADIADGDADTWGEISGIPGDIADGDDDTLGDLACAGGQIPIRSGGSWTCGDPPSSGVMYTRWGRNDCPSGHELVYAGWAGGSRHDHGGSGANALCLTQNPEWGLYNDGNQNGGLVYGGEYQTSGMGLGGSFPGLHDQDPFCAVCVDNDASIEMMIPATRSCPSGWSEAYDGYLMSTHYQQGSSEFVCVDENPEARTGSTANNDGALWYPVEAECGSLPCGPYVQNRELTCVVCTR